MNKTTKLKTEIANAKAGIAFNESFQKLRKTKAFKEIIEKGYFEDEAQRLVMMKSNPGMQTPEHQACIDNDIIAIGGLFQYFQAIVANGTLSANALTEKENLLEEFETEDLDTE